MSQYNKCPRCNSSSPHKLTPLERELSTAATNAAAVISSIYQWLERVEAAGGAKSLEGVAACHAMLTSMRKNADRTETLVMVPVRAAIARAKEKANG